MVRPGRSARLERRACAVACAVLAAGNDAPAQDLAGPVLAQGPADAALAEPVRFEYQVPEGCPGVEALRAEVAARTPLARLARDEEPARTFVVQLDRRERDVVGTLGVMENGAESALREIRAETCDDAISALALVIAIAVDPEVAYPSRAQKPAGDVSTAPLVQPSPVADFGAQPRPDLPSARRDPGARWMLAATAGIAVGALPGATVQPGLGGGVDLPAGGLRPSARFDVLRSLPRDGVTPSDRSATMTLTRGRLLGGAALSDSVRTFAVGAVIEGGLFEARGTTGVDEATARTRPWSAAGAGARVEWDLRGGFLVAATGTLLAPLTRDRFSLHAPAETVHRVPAVIGDAGLGLGVRFE